MKTHTRVSYLEISAKLIGIALGTIVGVFSAMQFYLVLIF